MVLNLWVAGPLGRQLNSCKLSPIIRVYTLTEIVLPTAPGAHYYLHRWELGCFELGAPSGGFSLFVWAYSRRKYARPYSHQPLRLPRCQQPALHSSTCLCFKGSDPTWGKPTTSTVCLAHIPCSRCLVLDWREVFLCFHCAWKIICCVPSFL
jgi:hypothetical protein